MVVERKSRKGRTFFGCANYPKCDFVSWDLRRAGTVSGVRSLRRRENAPRHDQVRVPHADTTHDDVAMGGAPAGEDRAARPSDAVNGDRGRTCRMRGGLATCAPRGARSTCSKCARRRSGPAHNTGMLAELVCSNSLRGVALENAVGLLKEELARARIADRGVARAKPRCRPAARWPSTACGSARWSSRGFRASRALRFGAKKCGQSRATGWSSLPADRCPAMSFWPSSTRCFGVQPESAGCTIMTLRRRSSRPSRSTSRRRIASRATIRATADETTSTFRSTGSSTRSSSPTCARSSAIRPKSSNATTAHATSKAVCRSRRWPSAARILCASVRSNRSACAIRAPDRTPYAVVQLRKENAGGIAYNLVGFQTRLTWPAQKEAFGKLPGLEGAEWLRLGVMHRNTFIDSPRLLDARLQLHGSAGHLLRRPDHRCRRLRRSGGLRPDGGNRRCARELSA